MRKSKMSSSVKDIESEVKEARTIEGRKRLREEIEFDASERDVISSSESYWEFISDNIYLDDEVKEDAEANPDILGEDSTLHPRAFNSAKVERLFKKSDIMSKLHLLSSREREVLEMVCVGYSFDEISKLLIISKSAVNEYINRARSKLN